MAKKSKKRSAPSLSLYEFSITLAGHCWTCVIPCEDGVEAVRIAGLIARELKGITTISAQNGADSFGEPFVLVHQDGSVETELDESKPRRGRPRKEKADAAEAV